MPVNTHQVLINKIYPHLNITIPSAKYLSQRAILALANIDVLEINNFYMDKLQGLLFLKYSNNVLMDPEMRENYANKFFHYYREASLSLHILQLKVGMLVIILRNLEALTKYNGIRAWIIHIGQHTIEAEVIGGRRADTQIVIPRISLQFKDNKGSISCRMVVFCQFTWQQYPICPLFAMIINKFQGQSL